MIQESPDESRPDESRIVTAKSSKFQAMLFNLGNIIAMMPGVIVAPLAIFGSPEHLALIIYMLFMIVPPILWFGVSIITYAMTRHHPNELVGHYIQQAAYRYYALFGSIIPIGTFFGTDWRLWIITGGMIAAILIPWSLYAIWQITKDEWRDTVIPQSS